MFGRKHDVLEDVASHVPQPLPADEAARIAYEHDKDLTHHSFAQGEHPVVRIEHLNKTFDGQTVVLRDVNLNVWPGEVVCVLGPSGSGKSTMLRCINLLEKPTAGHILIEDKEITGVSDAEANNIRRNLGMVFQSFNLFPHLSAKENVMIGQTKVLKLSKAEAEREALKQLEAVGLGDRADFMP
ncbi:MAG: amino acid ABC transporter ATP-binding protein, partial [Atopobiaceae bacterium]|nr:amino acid ABC transporter ATP-binding protein [Atopobiaceae bacterium]